jgi:hypothetical protein
LIKLWSLSLKEFKKAFRKVIFFFIAFKLQLNESFDACVKAIGR